jgi:DNA-3-methyladenine glycosylase
MNLVTGPEDQAEAVLIRALEPTAGVELMQARRGRDRPTELCSGPGKLCQALAVGLDENGADVFTPPFELILPAGERPEVAAGPRIGISAATDVPWRFGAAGSPYLSRPIGRRRASAPRVPRA